MFCNPNLSINLLRSMFRYIVIIILASNFNFRYLTRPPVSQGLQFYAAITSLSVKPQLEGRMYISSISIGKPTNRFNILSSCVRTRKFSTKISVKPQLEGRMSISSISIGKLTNGFNIPSSCVKTRKFSAKIWKACLGKSLFHVSEF